MSETIHGIPIELYEQREPLAAKQRRFGNRFMMLKYYVNHRDEARAKLQILCANCNWIKRAENKELPVIIEQPRTLVAKKDLETVMPLEAFLSE